MKNVIVDYRIDIKEKNVLLENGYNVLTVPPCKDVYNAISGHPDIQLCMLNSNTAVVYKNMPYEFIKQLKELNLNIIKSKNDVKNKYPYDIILNAVNLKNFFIHNLKYTDDNLYKKISYKSLINVKQGYTKCSTAIISDNAIITSDTGISQAASKNGLDVLLLPNGDIELTNFDYGFIGGTCGILDNNTIAFYGNLENYKYGAEVLSFIKKYNLKPLYLRDSKLIDRGSILYF
ncbi:MULTISPECIES: DUF6873 family GME fold protein [Clostridium]|uniref:DUF6873 family GME fold protein n=1 Tax=Clostridium TaxID=1485 RepID=UPI00069DB41B|nr:MULTISPECIES: hypothetical protein [Clostridium]KOF55987.1 hypothetical protein AGR56_03055 [Clostridium sp. DMHC 10]MCD2345401.1 hypothetical protein [Clostridium guangxiense]